MHVPPRLARGSEVCGLSFSDGKFAKVCGQQMGYWTANQACLLNAVGASAYFSIVNRP